MNARLIEGALAMLARLIPPEEYAKATHALNELAGYAKSIDDRAKRIEDGFAEMRNRLDMLETIVRANVPGAEAVYAEQAMWMVPGSIESALAPSSGEGFIPNPRDKQ